MHNLFNIYDARYNRKSIPSTLVTFGSSLTCSLLEAFFPAPEIKPEATSDVKQKISPCQLTYTNTHTHTHAHMIKMRLPP